MRRKETMALHIGVIVDMHLNDAGVPLFTVVDGAGNIFYPCSVMSSLAGSDGCFSFCSPRMGATVVVFDNPGPVARNYFILGGIMHPNDSSAINVDGERTAIEANGGRHNIEDQERPYYINQDYKDVHVRDYHVQNLNSYINMSDRHGLTIHGHPRISFEVGGDAASNVFRFAADGVAGNRVLNAHSFLDRLFKHIGDLHTKINALEAAINVLNPAVINALNAASALASIPTVPGEGLNTLLSAPLLEISAQVAQSATELAATPQPRASATVRNECNRDKNPFIITP